MTLWERKKYGNSKKIGGFWRLGVGEGEILDKAQGIIRAVKKYILYDNVMVDIW